MSFTAVSALRANSTLGTLSYSTWLDQARPHDERGDCSSKTIVATRYCGASRAWPWRQPASRNHQETRPLKRARRRALRAKADAPKPCKRNERKELGRKTVEDVQPLATRRTGTMQKELAEAAEEGFRLLPRTMISKKQIIGGVEVVVILERPPNLEKRYQYKLLATNRTSTLAKGSCPGPGRGLCSGRNGQSRRTYGDHGKGKPRRRVKLAPALVK